MKQIFTLLSAVVFTVLSANAQITEKFENYAALPSNCWQLTATREITGAQVISDAASIGAHATDTSFIRTPYLDISGLTHVSFKYLLNNKLNNNSERNIEVGTTDKNGTFVSASSIILTNSSPFKSVQIFDANLLLTTGVQRLTIRVTAKSGDGNSFLTIDDLSVTGAAYHYGATPCNTAPVATDASFNAFGYAPFNGSIATRASDANSSETIMFALDTLYSVNGTLVLQADGTFTFTPAGNFTGGTVTFKYKVTDDGYDPLTSNIATVILNYPAMIPLPVYMTNFSANVNSGKAQLSWTVAQNENGSQFTVEKSTDGKAFTATAVVMTTTKAGSESYRYSDAGFGGKAYYRLKIVDNNAVVTYSRTVYLEDASDVKASNLTLLQNPVSSSVNFDYTATASGVGSVNVYNLAGVKIFTTQIMMNKGRNTTSVNLNNSMAPGAYIMEVTNGSDRGIAKLVKR
jgi:hypothetical protein